MITVQNLTRKFGSTLAIDGLSFHLERGELVGFLGPNGAGKTTTMRILAGYLPATSGSAQVAGFDVLRQSLAVRSRIGYLPESVPLYREHRVREMLDFQGRLHGLARTERKRRVPAVLERVGIADRAQSLIGELSRGQRQRVGLAVALLPEPEVLILDEPTSGLDPLQRLEVRKLLSELARERTVLLSSHILAEIEALCPRVIILVRGKIAADGRRDELVLSLAGASFVRLEAFVGANVAEALRLLAALPGARSVEDRGRLGIHHVFAVHSDEDLREDVGALAAQKGWALRELSWRRPTLEEIFARLALGLEGAERSAALAVPGARTAAHAAPQETGPIALSFARATAAPASAPAAVPKVVYNLNPFDRGATRDLGKPKAVEPPPPPGPPVPPGPPGPPPPQGPPGPPGSSGSTS